MNTKAGRFILLVIALLTFAYVAYGWLFVNTSVTATVTGKHSNVYESRLCKTATTYSKCETSKEESYIIYTDLPTLFLNSSQEVSVNLIVFDRVEIGKRYQFLGNGWPCCIFISEILMEGQ